MLYQSQKWSLAQRLGVSDPYCLWDAHPSCRNTINVVLPHGPYHDDLTFNPLSLVAHSNRLHRTEAVERGLNLVTLTRPQTIRA